MRRTRISLHLDSTRATSSSSSRIPSTRIPWNRTAARHELRHQHQWHATPLRPGAADRDGARCRTLARLDGAHVRQELAARLLAVDDGARSGQVTDDAVTSSVGSSRNAANADGGPEAGVKVHHRLCGLHVGEQLADDVALALGAGLPQRAGMHVDATAGQKLSCDRRTTLAGGVEGRRAAAAGIDVDASVRCKPGDALLVPLPHGNQQCRTVAARVIVGSREGTPLRQKARGKQ
mmetsp:Transcript_5733/g.20568  ORF Transcript_5733/g.20568 Transcript_5733/m.20568 type:complete len:235 (-) Transcript_5733:488-1192(-)